MRPRSLEENFIIFKEKYSYLIERWRSMTRRSGRILLVRHEMTDRFLNGLEGNLITQETAAEMRDTISYIYRDLDFEMRILYSDPSKAIAEDHKISVGLVKHAGSDPWSGSDEEWDRAMRGYSVPLPADYD